MYAFTKEFYHKWSQPNGDLFVILDDFIYDHNNISVEYTKDLTNLIELGIPETLFQLLTGLFVADASLLPQTVRGNIHLTVLMLAELLVDRMRQQSLPAPPRL